MEELKCGIDQTRGQSLNSISPLNHQQAVKSGAGGTDREGSLAQQGGCSLLLMNSTYAGDEKGLTGQEGGADFGDELLKARNTSSQNMIISREDGGTFRGVFTSVFLCPILSKPSLDMHPRCGYF